MPRRILAITFFILAGAFAFLYAVPKYQATVSLKADIARFDSALLTAREVDLKLNDLKRSYATVSDQDRSLLASVVPHSFDQLRLFNDIKTIATEEGVTVSSVGVSKDIEPSRGRNDAPVSDPGYKTETISLAVDGKYKNLVAFTERLERSLQLLDVVGVTIETGVEKKGEKTTLYRFSLTLHTYWINK